MGIFRSTKGWNFSASPPVADRKAVSEGEFVILSSVVRNTGIRLGTAYVRFLIADSYKRELALFDSHRDWNLDACQSLRLADITIGEPRRVSCSWEVPAGLRNHHCDLRLEVWNPHFLFGGRSPHLFFDSGWVSGFEILSHREEAKTAPVFISYSHDDPEHLQWVRSFVTELKRHGIRTIADFDDLAPGQDIGYFIEQAVRSSCVRLLVCSDAYTRKADEREPGGVGYETIVSAHEFYHLPVAERERFIPVVRRNSLPQGRRIPAYLGNLLYENMEGTDWRSDPMQRLLLRLRALLRTGEHS